MMRSLSSLSIILIFILIGCSANNRYKTAHNLYRRKNYVVAIQQYDRYLERSANGAFATQAEYERGECYFHLGIQAYKKESWLLSSRLLFLANNESADDVLDNCYYKLAQMALEVNDTEKTLDYYDKIIKYLNTSELIPEILYERINLYLILDRKEDAFLDFKRLWKDFPDNYYLDLVMKIIDPVIEFKLDQSIADRESGNLENSLQNLLALSEYPTNFRDRISVEIAVNYLKMAEKDFTENKLESAANFYEKAIEFDPEKRQFVTDRIVGICQNFISQGNKFKDNLEIEKAVSSYERCFLLIEDYNPAKTAIQSAINYDQNFKQALSLKEQARAKESKKLFADALKLYENSYALYHSREVQVKIEEMNNLIRAEKDPKGFAEAIIKNYKSGSITGKIREIENRMVEKYGSEIVRIPGWKVTYSSGDYKYEVRYDILTPNETYYFIWLVDLRDKSISPLNKLSEIL